jgi:hypothetical protein
MILFKNCRKALSKIENARKAAFWRIFSMQPIEKKNSTPADLQSY